MKLIKYCLLLVGVLSCSIYPASAPVKHEPPKKTATNSPSQPPQNQKKHFIDLMIEASEPQQFLLSFPRSGNTWMRYMIEFLTRRPTAYRPNQNKMNLPIGSLEKFKIDYSKSPVWKAHSPNDLRLNKIPDTSKDLLIFVVRNPKECMTRHFGRSPNRNDLINGEYFINLRAYDEWNPDKRLLVRYEDLVVKPQEVARQLLTFLGDPDTYFNEFFDNYEFHKSRALSIYSQEGSRSKGSDVLFHSKKIDSEYLKQIDAWIAELHPTLWEKYLSVYAEELLCDEKKCT
jgi:hypothetical protein